MLASVIRLSAKGGKVLIEARAEGRLPKTWEISPTSAKMLAAQVREHGWIHQGGKFSEGFGALKKEIGRDEAVELGGTLNNTALPQYALELRDSLESVADLATYGETPE